jgi:DNA-binding MarR family transcriptional regulator
MDNIGKDLIQLFKSHRNFLANKLADIGLFTGQEGLLYHLSLNDGQTMSEIVGKMKIQHATLFTMVARMAKNNLLTKDKHETDKRASRIFLTEKGKEKIEKLSIIWQETEKQILKNITAKEKEELFRLLKKINQNLT